MKRNISKFIYIQLVFCIMLTIYSNIFAENSLDYHEDLFKLDEVKTSVKEGDENIAIDSVISLVFTKNISGNKEIIENNTECINIEDENNKEIDIELEFIDNVVNIKPINLLEEESKYKIIVNEGLSTNEEYLEKQLPITISFTTEKKIIEEPNVEEDIVDTETLIKIIKEATIDKNKIEVKEVDKDRIEITIISETDQSTYSVLYLGNIYTVEEIIRNIEDSIIDTPKEEEKENNEEDNEEDKEEDKLVEGMTKPEGDKNNEEDLDKEQNKNEQIGNEKEDIKEKEIENKGFYKEAILSVGVLLSIIMMYNM